MKRFKHLGKKVECTSYYRKVRDGIFIMCLDKNGMRYGANNQIENAVAVDSDGNGTDLEFCGDGIEKTLYNLVNKNFTGVCVGEKRIIVKEYLYSDFDYDWLGNEVKFIGKQIIDFCDCYIIYYANNRKRYVPKECCNFVEDIK